jgi:hypothetical protein
MATNAEKNDAPEVEHQASFHKTGLLGLDVQDGDDALKVLHAEFEPYTKEEETRVLRKIDLRMIFLMLLVNGIQFVDKMVSLHRHTSDF